LPGSVETLYSPELVEGRDFNPHMVVAGASGSGKTTFLYHLVKELSENYPTVFIDIKGDITRALLRERVNAHIVPVAAVGINPFHSIVDGEKERHMVERLIDSISVVEEVGSKQAHFIREAYAEMEHSKTPLTYGGLLARVVAKEEKALSADGSPYSRFGGGTRDALVGISSKLKDLAEYLRDDGASMKDIMGRVLAGRESNYPILVFNLEDISEKVRAVVLELILRSIARYMYHRGPLAYLRDKAIILAVDEAYLVTRPMRREEGRSKSVLEEIARAGRSYGLALILATQRLSDVADGIRQNCQTWIVFNTASPEDKRILKEIDAEVMASVVSELNPGEAYIRVPNPRRREYYRTTTDTIAAVIGYIFRMERELLQAERKDAEKLLQKLEKKKKTKRGRRLQVEEAGLEEAGGDTGGGVGERDSSLLNYGVVCYRCMLLTSNPNYCSVCGQSPLLKRPEPITMKKEVANSWRLWLSLEVSMTRTLHPPEKSFDGGG
jgi:DNA polymerase III delta prime subunit